MSAPEGSAVGESSPLSALTTPRSTPRGSVLGSTHRVSGGQQATLRPCGRDRSRDTSSSGACSRLLPPGSPDRRPTNCTGSSSTRCRRELPRQSGTRQAGSYCRSSVRCRRTPRRTRWRRTDRRTSCRARGRSPRTRARRLSYSRSRRRMNRCTRQASGPQCTLHRRRHRATTATCTRYPRRRHLGRPQYPPCCSQPIPHQCRPKRWRHRSEAQLRRRNR